MVLITGVGIIALSVLTAALSRMLTEEIVAWSPWIVRRVIRLAATWLPENQRERFKEEWQSHVNEVPGTFGKLLSAAGFLLAARNIEYDLSRSQHSDYVLPHTSLRIGQRVRIRGGSMDGVEGVLLSAHGDRTLIISVDAIQRSLAVRVEGYDVEVL